MLSSQEIQVVMVPVPVDRLQDVYRLLSEAPPERATSSASSPIHSLKEAASRLLEAALPMERRLLRELANHPDAAVTSKLLAEKLEGDSSDRNFIPGILGPLGKRSRDVGFDKLPFETVREEGETAYMMSRAVAEALLSAGTTSESPSKREEPSVAVARLMDQVASDLAIRIEQTPASRKYRPNGQAGAWLQPKQGNLYFDMRPFTDAGDDSTRALLLDRMARIAGKPIQPMMAGLPLSVVASDWGQARDEVILPYFYARLGHSSPKS